MPKIKREGVFSFAPENAMDITHSISGEPEPIPEHLNVYALDSARIKVDKRESTIRYENETEDEVTIVIERKAVKL